MVEKVERRRERYAAEMTGYTFRQLQAACSLPNLNPSTLPPLLQHNYLSYVAVASIGGRDAQKEKFGSRDAGKARGRQDRNGRQTRGHSHPPQARHHPNGKKDSMSCERGAMQGQSPHHYLNGRTQDKQCDSSVTNGIDGSERK